MDKNNEIYNFLVSVNEPQMAQDLSGTVIKYLLKQFPNKEPSMQDVLFIQPKKLCKIMNEKKLLYEPMVVSIMQYKTINNTDSGFTYKQYERALEIYKGYLSNQQHISKIKRREVVKEDYIDIYEYYTNNPNYELVTEKTTTSFVKKNLNTRIGKLVLKHPYRRTDINDASIYWLCQCDCGSWVMLQKADLKHIKSCGCDNMENYIGQRHEHLECIDQVKTITKNGHKTIKLKVKCDCGNEKIMSIHQFKNAIYCGRWCGIADWSANNGEHLKRLFKNKTNISKIGRTEANKNSTTGYAGVTYLKKIDKYMSYIVFQGERETLGFYNLPESAYQARLKAQRILQQDCLEELEKDEEVLKNKYLLRLLNKVKEKIKNMPVAI